MASHPVRVERGTYEEVQGASRLLGRTPGELLARAWDQYKRTEEFREEFRHVQQIIEAGDLGELTRHLDERADAWADEAAGEVRALRDG